MTDTPHLDDDALSAVLDGEGTAEEAAHADTCDGCGARLEVLRDASLLVRTPVSPAGDADRDRAIARAMGATAAAADIAPLRTRRPAPVWLAAAAIAVVVAIGGIALANRGDDGGGSNDLAADRTTAADSAAGGEAPAPNAAVAGPVDGGDVGEVQGADLRSRIDAALAGSRDEAKDSVATGAAAEAAAPDCESDVRAGNPDLGPLVYRARGTYDGAPVAVLAFDTNGRRWVYVVGDDCGIRNQTTYSV